MMLAMRFGDPQRHFHPPQAVFVPVELKEIEQLANRIDLIDPPDNPQQDLFQDI